MIFIYHRCIKPHMHSLQPKREVSFCFLPSLSWHILFLSYSEMIEMSHLAVRLILTLFPLPSCTLLSPLCFCRVPSRDENSLLTLSVHTHPLSLSLSLSTAHVFFSAPPAYSYSLTYSGTLLCRRMGSVLPSWANELNKPC